jgi:hypothetical protein
VKSPRKIGRPPIDPSDDSAQLSLKLPSKQLAALKVEAEHAGCTLHDLLRRRLARASLQTRRARDDDER